MSSAADKQRAKAARLSAARRAPVEAAPPQPVRAERTKMVRTTVDLSPPLHAEFEDWAIALGRDLGRSRIRSDAVRVLIRELLDDPELAARVRAALAAEFGRSLD